MNSLDTFLNKVTMHRLVLYVLGILAALGVAFAFTGRLSASPTGLVMSLSLLASATYLTDRGLSRFLGIPTNMESSLITALILFLIVQPADNLRAGLVLVLAGVIASVSKFLIVWRGKHIFNPAALAAAVLNFTGLQTITWWVGSSLFWPFSLLLGLAVVRKVRRFPLWLVFISMAVVVQGLVYLQAQQPLADEMRQALIASPLIFLSTIMLTEPATMPPRRNQQLVFGALVAILYATAWGVGSFTIYPEIALLIGNLLAFIITPKFHARLKLTAVNQVTERVYDYVFQPDRQLRFLPGQYMQWTLAHVPYDSRGNRRTFTIASSPTETEIHLGVKYYEPASHFKLALRAMQPGDTLYANQLAGNFTLQGNERKKLAFIAGGIGVTPFRSMVKYLTDTATDCDIVLVYLVGDAHEFAYLPLFQEAAKVGVRTVPVVTDPPYQAKGVLSAKLSAELLAQAIPDYTERIFYISGPNAMVDAIKQHLIHLGVSRKHIKTDHFSGY
jgi:ferredoxin-NADP reductase/Na+-translocating ferredoxin:NAD+ oxidoreductase RnfD subunit